MNIKKFISLMLTLLLTLSLCACSDDTSLYSVSFELNTYPSNIDPQLAESESELIIAGNIFEGLMRYDDKGELTTAAAKSYTVDETGKEYIFNISDKACWSNGKKVTANDFVFAFQRAVNSETKAPYANTLRSIRGVNDILDNGALTSSIGVNSTNEKTLVIDLAVRDDTFLATLATAICMPCNEEFFDKCKGKYGLDSNSILSNGSFVISKWETKDKTIDIKLSKNDKYNGLFEPHVNYTLLSLPKDDEPTGVEAIKNGDVNIAEIPFADTDDAMDKKLNVHKYMDTTYALIFNKNAPIADNDIINAFNGDINYSAISNSLSVCFELAESIFPKYLYINGQKCENLISNPPKVFTFDSALAREEMLKGIKTIKAEAFPQTDIIYIENAEIKEMLKSVVSGWQKDLGTYINTTPLSEEEFNSRLKMSDYTIALVPFKSSDGTADSFLSTLTTGSEINYSGYSNPELDATVSALSTAETTESKVVLLNSAASIIENDKYIIPLVHTSTVFANSSGISCGTFFPFGMVVDFAFIKAKSK